MELKANPAFFHAKHYQNFWGKGNGKALLDWAGYTPDIKDFENFSHLYHQVDEIADRVVKETYLKLPYPEASKIIKKYSVNKISENDDAPESLKRLFLQMQEIPNWSNEDLANEGAKLCMRAGVNALIILRDFTLMGGYDFDYLNKPLIYTGALKKGAIKRLKDTLEFWVGVTRTDALKINSAAYQLIVRTRLMHSYARLSILEKIEDWNFEKWGMPINHWDMIATYTGFSLVFMQGLKKIGIKISEREELGVYHLWKYVGYLLGIPEQYLPENRQCAVEQLYLWSATQDGGTGDAQLLAKALLDENLENTIYKFKFQRHLLLDLHKSMNWFMLDREVLNRLKIDKPKTGLIFPKLVCRANKISQNIHKNNKEKLVKFGHQQQMQVLKDYIDHTSNHH